MPQHTCLTQSNVHLKSHGIECAAKTEVCQQPIMKKSVLIDFTLNKPNPIMLL